MANKCEFNVNGMHCDACELYVEEIAKQETGVTSAQASSENQKLILEVEDPSMVHDLIARVNKKIEKQGYSISSSIRTQEKQKMSSYAIPFSIALVVSVLYFIYGKDVDPTYSPETFTAGSALVLGFIASISTCMAVVGGIVATFAASVAKQKKSTALAYFHGARLLGFAFLGGIMGYLGRFFILNASANNILEVVISVAMILVGLELLDLNLPRITFPKFLSKPFHLFSDKDRITDGILIGIGTFFLPCGVTQSAQLQALQQGSFLGGAAIMGAFALGTFPVLYLIGSGSASVVSVLKHKMLQNTFAFILVLTAITSLIARFV